MITGPRAADLFGPGMHGTTFGGNPYSAAAALAVLTTIDDEGLVEARRHPRQILAAGIEDLDHPLIDHVRGSGLLLGVVLRRRRQGSRAAARDAGFPRQRPRHEHPAAGTPAGPHRQQAQSFIDALPAILDTAQGEQP